MDEQTLHCLRLYLNGDMDLDTLESRIVLMLPNVEARDGSPAFELLAEVIYVWDGLSDEAAFRQRAAKLLYHSSAPATAVPA